MAQNERPTLHIEVSGAEFVLFSNKNGFPRDIWNGVVAWWNGVSKNLTSSSFEVPINEFSLRKGWLRVYWADKGFLLSVDPELSTILKKIESEINEFEAIADSLGQIGNSSFQLDNNGIIRNLTSFQSISVASLVNMRNGANFSVPGAGKTTTALVVWDQLKKIGMIEKVLVIAPRSAFEAWEQEPIEIFSAPPKTQIFDENPISDSTGILIINYEKLESPERISRLQYWMKQSKVMLIIDEAHRIKSGNFSVRYKAAKELVRYATRTELLTGTPLPQGLDDLRNLLHLSWKNLPSAYFSDTRLQNLKRGGIFVRTTKSELDLPPVTIREVMVPMGEMQTQIYSALGRNYMGQFAMNAGEERYFRGRGKAVFTLLAAAVNPGLLLNRVNESAYLDVTWPPKELLGDERLQAIVNDYIKYEIPPKYVWLTNLMQSRSISKSKVLVWSNFVGNLKAIEKILAPFNPVLIYGGTPPDERKLLLKKFREDPECLVLLSNPQTLGEGVSLHQVCHEAVYVDRSYNAGHYLQSVDRIHRLGLPSSQETQIHFLVSERSIDERVRRRLDVKIQRLATILDDKGLVAGTIPNADEDFDLNIGDLDFSDLSDLFNHLRQI